MMRALTLVCALAAATACAPRAEEPILSEFFQASRLRDRTALQPIATVTFDPALEGIVRAFEITRVTPKPDRAGTVKDVWIRARVAPLDGPAVEKRLIATLELKDRRWIVTAIAPAPLPDRSTPPS